MRIGVPKEIKIQEHRVGLTPASVRELVNSGHEVWVEHHAGDGSGFLNSAYTNAGAKVVSSAEEIYNDCTLIVKVKEPQAAECALLKPGQTIFTYLHLAPDHAQTSALLKSGATCIAYETVQDVYGRLPLLAPMSEVAGRMAIQAGARCLEKSQHGQGLLLAGVPGVPPATVLILGAGVVGSNAVRMAVGLGANVIVMDRSVDALRRLDQLYGNRIQTIYATQQALAEWILNADLVVGAVLLPGATAPKLVSRQMLKTMKLGAAIVDVSIDQGGCFESSRPTTHDDSTYVEEDVVHYCVANMPGAVARTSSLALNNATLPYVLKLANLGIKEALTVDAGFLNGLNIVGNQVCCGAVAVAQGLKSISLKEGLKLV